MRFRIPITSKGRALVATLSIISLLVMIGLAMFSLTVVTVQAEGNRNYRELARANARLALTETLATLQSSMGNDQRVCIASPIYETPSLSELMVK